MQEHLKKTGQIPAEGPGDAERGQQGAEPAGLAEEQPEEQSGAVNWMSV